MNLPKISHLIYLSAVCLLLDACSVGPEYRRPDLDVPSAYKSPSGKDSDDKTQLPENWWTLFGDPDLTALVEEAQRSNPGLQAAMARVTASRAASQSTKGQFYPTLTLDPSTERARQPKLRSNQASTTTTTFIPFDLSYEVDIWGRVRKGYEASKAQYRASEADYAVIMQTLVADLAQNYFNLRSFDSQEEILKQNIELYKKQLTLTETQFKSGLVSKSDILQAKTLLDSTLVQEMEVNRQRADTEHAIAILLGKAPVQLSLPFRTLDLEPPTIPPGLPADLLRQRPDVAEAEQNLIAANAQVGVAKASFFPVVKLTGAAGFESIDIQRTFDWESRIWSLGPSISVPIFEGGQLNANLRQAKARYEEVVANFRTTVLGAYRDVEDALTDLHFRSNEAEAQARAVDNARESLRLAETQYKQGLVSYLQIIEANRTLLSNQLSSVQIQNQRLVSTVLLIKAIGGGWQPNDAESAEQPK